MFLYCVYCCCIIIIYYLLFIIYYLKTFNHCTRDVKFHACRMTNKVNFILFFIYLFFIYLFCLVCWQYFKEIHSIVIQLAFGNPTGGTVNWFYFV